MSALVIEDRIELSREVPVIPPDTDLMTVVNGRKESLVSARGRTQPH